MSRVKFRSMVFVSIITLAGGATFASETTTYKYDALGRLASGTIIGGPNDTRKIATCFDAAGNRIRYDVGTTTPTP